MKTVQQYVALAEEQIAYPHPGDQDRELAAIYVGLAQVAATVELTKATNRPNRSRA